MLGTCGLTETLVDILLGTCIAMGIGIIANLIQNMILDRRDARRQALKDEKEQQ